MRRDQSRNEKRADVLSFTSEKLAENLVITGQIKAVLYVSSDRPDTDFVVHLNDVYPGGLILSGNSPVVACCMVCGVVRMLLSGSVCNSSAGVGAEEAVPSIIYNLLAQTIKVV